MDMGGANSHEQHGAMDMESSDNGGHDHAQMMEEAEKADLPVGIEEKLGTMLPDAEFTDSEGNRVNLRELTDVPTILLPIYYRCPTCAICSRGPWPRSCRT